MPREEWQRLDQVFEQAREQGDERTATRLSELLGLAEGFDDSESERDSADLSPLDLVDRLIGGKSGFSDIVLEFGGVDNFLDTMRRQLGKTAFDRMRREVNGSKLQVARVFFDMLASAALPTAPGGPGWPGGPARIVPPKGRGPDGARPSPGHDRQLDFFDD